MSNKKTFRKSQMWWDCKEDVNQQLGCWSWRLFLQRSCYSERMSEWTHTMRVDCWSTCDVIFSYTTEINDKSKLSSFLGGLSLHLNHLIASRAANYDWPFGTLPFGLFGSNLDTRHLETYHRTYSSQFWNMSVFDDSRAIWVLFRKWVVSENCILLRNGWPTPGYSDLVLGGEVPRLNHEPIFFPIQNT